MAVQQFLMMGRAGLDTRNIISGSMWVWGRNNYGQNATGNTTTTSVPLQVGSLTTWQNTMSPACYEGSRNVVKSDGTMWAWGRNNSGANGLGDTTSRSSPVQVGSDTDWKEAGVYGGNSAAIKTDGTLWTWGENYIGQLGNGNTTSRSSPAQVGSATDWEHLLMDGSNSDWALVMKSNGAIYYAGTGSHAGLADVNTFTQLGSETGFTDAALSGKSMIMWKEA